MVQLRVLGAFAAAAFLLDRRAHRARRNDPRHRRHNGRPERDDGGVLFGVDPANPAVFAAAAGLALVMTLAGRLLPAWRAMRIDPIAATRTE